MIYTNLVHMPVSGFKRLEYQADKNTLPTVRGDFETSTEFVYSNLHADGYFEEI